MKEVERLAERVRRVELLESRVNNLERRIESESVRCVGSGEKSGECRARGDEGVDIWEKEERMKRRTSVIVHGLGESEAADAAVRRNFDQASVTDMFRELSCSDVEMEKVIRLGKKGVPMNGVSPRPRPLKIVLASEEMRSKLLLRAKNLRNLKEGGWSRVFIHRDLTPMERGERRVAWQEMKNRLVGGERNLMEEVAVSEERGT